MPVDIDMDIDLDGYFDWKNILFKMPELELHQIVGSICVYPNPVDELAQIFGEPEETKGGLTFANGLFLSKYNKVFKNTLLDLLRTMKSFLDLQRFLNHTNKRGMEYLLPR